MIKEVKKPWGQEKHFVVNDKATVKILIVKPNQVLSLQKHKKRSELWYFLTEGYAQLGSKQIKVKKGGVVNIRKGQVHRLFSKGKEIRVLEIIKGRYEANDIIRLEDKYGRK
ncbi:MAG: mannose-6-phosphate isomerase [Nanoarchaeota archaeon]|nr:mannose-6-phosphate isomerase [Nanoarchaeota archaeon]